MKYFITGRVYPESASVWLNRVAYPIAGGGHFTIECHVSQLYIVWESPEFTDIDAVKITVENLAQTYVSAIGLSVGAGYVVEVTQVIGEDGSHHTYGPVNIALKFDNQEELLSACMPLAGRDAYFRFAIIDYGKAITNAIEFGFHCYRAIESIKCAFENDWSKMHDALGTTRAEIDILIKAHADAVRHGNWTAIPETVNDDRTKTLLLTRNILHKYLNYRADNALKSTEPAAD